MTWVVMGPWRLLSVLKKNTTLTSINLSKNNLGSDGAMAIASVLEKKHQTHLD